uniref:Ig-like domain-containing protein n=1 Tax=Amphilophus citrinellus TaxID=61819 RepID=A0A3Q0QVQ1_AMPCI
MGEKLKAEENCLKLLNVIYVQVISKIYSSTSEKKKEKPVFLSQLSTAAVNTGETATFTVKVSGFPKPTVQWSHNGKVIKSSSVYKLIEEKEEYTLVITQVTSEYEGKYSCTATNRFGQTTCTTYLEVKKPDVSQAEKWVEKMFKKITPLEINVGSHAKFECEIEEASDVTFKWYKSGTEIRQTEKYRILSRHSGSSLELVNPIKADSGEYTCKASNQHGTDSCTASLIVTGCCSGDTKVQSKGLWEICMHSRK